MSLPVAARPPSRAETLNRSVRVQIGFGLLIVALLASVLLAVLVGPTTIAPGETLQIVIYKLGLHIWAAHWPIQDEAIVWQLRVPRVVAAALVGVSLALAGCLFQGVLRNPLADPYVIGTSAGAQLGVTIALLLPYQLTVLGFGPIQLAAFVGALLTVLFVYGLARTAGGTPIVTLLLAGFVVSSFLISASSFLFLASNRLTQVVGWTMGSMDVAEFSQLAVTFPIIALTALLSFALAGRLDVILLGEEQATHLGIRVERVKLAGIVLAALLTALAVTLAGVVAFVGLVVPHAVRLLFGPRHRTLLPLAAVAGALFVVLADLLARTIIAPTQLPLGVVTAVVGAPFFLYLLRRSRRDYVL